MTAPPISERHLPHFHRRAPMKEAVRAATTASITISTALNNGDSLDGITLATGDRVLVKDQSTDSQNGIYVVGASPARDYDESTDDPSFGYLVFVREGTANGGTLWKNTNTSAPTVGSTSITFSQFSSGSSLTIKDEGSSLATAATSIDFVGGGVTASGTGAAKTVTIPGGGSGTVNTAKDASTTVTDPDTVKVTGTGGIAVSVSESPSGTAAFVIDGSGITGSVAGPVSVPVIVQAKHNGTNVSTITLDSTPVAGHSLILSLDGYNTGQATAVSSTNTTWTQIATVNEGSGAKIAIWVGVVAASAGTLITVTHPNAFMSMSVIEIPDTLTPTTGQTTTSTAGITAAPTMFATLAATTSGHLVAITGPTANTTQINRIECSVPVSGIPYAIVPLVVCYSQGYPIYFNSQPFATGLIAAELT